MNQPGQEIVIETVSLSKVYKDFWGRAKVKAVDDLNLQVNQGEVFGFLGPNGSGKTTTIKILLGLLYPTKGRARIFGRPASDVEVKARIGYLPEETRLYQFLDSWETLDFYARIFSLHTDDRSRRSEALVDMVGLGPAASRPVGQYSKGMARRIGLAQSLINDPDLLILDEPTSGLDPVGTRQIKDLLLELKKRGKTILLSSHLLADVEDVCDRIGIMYGGKLLCCGRIDELLAQQEVTQILAENLEPKQVQQISEYLTKTYGSKVFSIGSPRDRLERFFLRMVHQAQKNLETSGALAGGKVSDFLRAGSEEESPDRLFEKLTSNEPSPVPGTSIPAAAAPEPLRRDVLENLVAGPKDESISEGSVTDVREAKSESEPQVDRSLLDGLVDRGESKDGPSGGSTGG